MTTDYDWLAIVALMDDEVVDLYSEAEEKG